MSVMRGELERDVRRVMTNVCDTMGAVRAFFFCSSFIIVDM
jgi:hypothetical protein